ncbi:putative histidyl-tRNA synthetase [Lyophyllum shimeji]|uniref:histidine--tRNA ligase n=1 Tax=Lyophyllum shimeji TaxID=47721 RepID=A0A9P3UPZ0_LYOSH|nr:putative histidyl-tRNA synthetase [Lyophyllum shimeji]
MATPQILQQEIEKQTTLLNDLRTQKAAQELVDEAKKKLGELKKTLAQTTGAAAGAAKDAGKKRERMLLKTAKGTRDYGPAEMYCREHIERIVKDCFTAYGGSCLDTPVFERKDILAGKYGEDAKLIFDLMDQGGEQLALRYDHTVPLARYLAMMGANNTHAKLWQVGKVYRRDNPVMSKGRMREFSQADFDISGTWDPMIPDAELISLVCTIMTRLDVGEFTVKLNNRKILDGIFEVCGVPAEKIRSISSAVDKLDKLPWSEVKKEMTEEKGLDPAIADKIGEYVKHKGKRDLLDKLNADPVLTANARAQEGLGEMEILFSLLDAYKVMDKISFDLSLARGLDYYTGIIYEAIVEASAPPGFGTADALAPSGGAAAPAPAPKKAKKPKAAEGEEEEVDESQVGVGSLAAGGRYDGLVGMFNAAAAAEGKKAQELPCVGVSFGLDRVFAVVWPKWVEKGMRSKETMAYVVSMGEGLLRERVELVQELREAGIKADFLAKNKPKHQAQFAASEKDEVPFAIIIAPEEWAAGFVRVKEQRWELVDGQKVKVKTDASDKGTQVRRAELVSWLKNTPTLAGWASGRLVS